MRRKGKIDTPLPEESDSRDLGRPMADRTEEGILGDVDGASVRESDQVCKVKKQK
jgi:hypothetical protein